MGDQQEAEREHPEPENRQDRENPSEGEKKAGGNADPARIGVTELAYEPRHALGDLLLEIPESSPQYDSTVVHWLPHALVQTPYGPQRITKA